MKKIFIILLAIIFIFFILFIVWVLNDEDFNTYINKTEDISISLKGNPYIIGDVEDQIIKIA